MVFEECPKAKLSPSAPERVLANELLRDSMTGGSLEEAIIPFGDPRAGG